MVNLKGADGGMWVEGYLRRRIDRRLRSNSEVDGPKVFDGSKTAYKTDERKEDGFNGGSGFGS